MLVSLAGKMLYPLLLSLWFLYTSPARAASLSPPVATVKNGTLKGLHSSEWNQDHFLGIPFAQPPVGDLRFKWPRSVNTTWNGTLDATHYGYSCYQYGSNFNMSEDCLTLNVVRPAGYENKTLPVLVWIYGGGLYVGSTADPQYNLSGIVQTAAQSGQPFIAVSMNYRLGIWGFFQTPLIHAEGSSNAGLLDQRLAFQWIQENIASFGGDPSRVTVWGESAGAQSIGLHLHSYNGRNDNLFQAAILESGGPVGACLNALPFYQVATENLTRTLGCPISWTSASQLTCLRNLSSEALFSAHYTVTWNPIVDGDFLTAYPSTLSASGNFIKIPLITGANSDEGGSFSVHGLNTPKDVYDSLFYWRNYALSPPSIVKLLELYPDNPSIEPPYSDHSNTTYPSLGLEWRRSAAIGGDLVMIAQRRKMCELYTGAGQKVWSYRFDTPLWNASTPVVVKHFDNVVFSFQNISGALGPLPEYESYRTLSKDIGIAYARFVGTGDPNGSGVLAVNGTGNGTVTDLPYWPQWTDGKRVNIVLNSNGSFIEDDTFREDGIRFINTISRELLA